VLSQLLSATFSPLGSYPPGKGLYEEKNLLLMEFFASVGGKVVKFVVTGFCLTQSMRAADAFKTISDAKCSDGETNELITTAYKHIEEISQVMRLVLLLVTTYQIEPGSKCHDCPQIYANTIYCLTLYALES
jgi:hypothetical protein